MIPVYEVADGQFERIGGNPVLTSLDGEVRAPLATILADSWTPEERAAFGIYMAEPFVEPAGKVRVGQPRYEKVGPLVVEMFDVVDEPPPRPDPLEVIRDEIEVLKARISALETQ